MQATRILACPRCSVHMDVVEHGGVTVDHCATCQGLWLDGAEWKAMLGPAAALDNSIHLRGGVPLPCPACAGGTPPGQARAELVQRSLVDVADVVVDACPACSGAWLDGGELPRIRAQIGRRRAARPPAPPPAASLPVAATRPADGSLPIGAAVVDTLGETLMFLARPRPRRGIFSPFRRTRATLGDVLVNWLGHLLRRR